MSRELDEARRVSTAEKWSEGAGNALEVERNECVDLELLLDDAVLV
jgi:hypothetical protein